MRTYSPTIDIAGVRRGTGRRTQVLLEQRGTSADFITTNADASLRVSGLR